MIKLFSLFYIIVLAQCFQVENTENNTLPEPHEVRVGINIGDKAPDLAYPNPNGKIITLSSLRGKVVLIDFWASWCPPCRRENPELVAIYKDFSDKKFKNADGFTVYSVSCDQSKEAWMDAIKKDQLIWKNHVSDLKGWEAEATYTYRISSIPSNILIDGNGIIMAKDLQGETLRNYLEKLLAE